MNQTVLFTTQPKLYSELLHSSDYQCSIFTNERQMETYLCQYQPSVILIDTTYLDYNQSQLMKNFGSHFRYHPSIVLADREMLIQLFSIQTGNHPKEQPLNVPPSFGTLIDNALLTLGFSPSLKGYFYLKQAVCFEHLHTSDYSDIKKDVYQSISEACQASICSIERSITFAIRKAYTQKPEEFYNLFPCLKKAPTNANFLKTFYIHLKQKETLS